MANSLGIYVESNLIKYAKIAVDKATNEYKLEAYGVKFCDNIAQAIKDITVETNSKDVAVSTNTFKEDYTSFDVFSSLKPKDRSLLVETEFSSHCVENGVPANVVEMRHFISKNTGNPDIYKAICISTSKTEINTTWSQMEGLRINNITPVTTSIVNLFPNRGLNEKTVIVNLEDKTYVSVLNKGEIVKIFTIPIGVGDVLEKLKEKYNSYSKAYDACKGASAIDNGENKDEESAEITQLILPTIYDIMQRVSNGITEVKSDIHQIYLTGTGTIINNIDICFQEFFEGMRCDVLRPFFVNKEDNNVQQIIEVNSATALALNGVGFLVRDLDFNNTSGKSYIATEALKKKIKEMDVKKITEDIKNRISGVFLNLKDSVKDKAQKMKKPKRAKAEVFFESDDEQPSIESKKVKEIKEKKAWDALDAWLLRTAIGVVALLFVYVGLMYSITKDINDKVELTEQRIAIANKNIASIETDATYINEQATSYYTKRIKLEEILNKITEMEQRSYDIPNFLSVLMFIIPEDVKTNSITIASDKSVVVDAESGRYAQLGYLVSRLKIENALKNVNMYDITMNNDIKIKVKGDLP